MTLNLHPSVQHHQPTIRTPWRVGTRPIQCAESNRVIHLSIGLMEKERKSGGMQEKNK